MPYIDEVKWPVVNEYATFLAQFKAGAIHVANGIRAEDILPVKKDHPELEIMQAPFTTRIQRIGFGVAEGSPFRDERLRQAWSMTVDRGLYLDTVYNLQKFKDGGLPGRVGLGGRSAGRQLQRLGARRQGQGLRSQRQVLQVQRRRGQEAGRRRRLQRARRR